MAGYLCQRCLAADPKLCTCEKEQEWKARDSVALDGPAGTMLLPSSEPKAVVQERPPTEPVDLEKDSGDRFLDLLSVIGKEDASGLKKAYESYGPSWKKRGGVGAYMMACRKYDRMEERLKKLDRKWDIFHGIATDNRGEGLIDDVRDLRRYLMLIEAEMRARGFRNEHRDNK